MMTVVSFILLAAVSVVIGSAVTPPLLWFVAPSSPFTRFLIRDHWELWARRLLCLIAGREYQPPMTAEDYEQLRKWEADLELEPTEVPARLLTVHEAVNIEAQSRAAAVHERLTPTQAELDAGRALREAERGEREVERSYREAKAGHPPVVPHPYLPGACTHPESGITYVFTPENFGPTSTYCGVCGVRVSGPPRTDKLIREQIIASQGIPPARLGPEYATDPVAGSGVWQGLPGAVVVPPPQAGALDRETMADMHFAKLAKMGLFVCFSDCTICRAAGRQPGHTDQGWIEEGRWEPTDGATMTSRYPPPGASDFHLDGLGREWLRDPDDLLWIKPVPDGPWWRQS
jgi:hypothetical protein